VRSRLAVILVTTSLAATGCARATKPMAPSAATAPQPLTPPAVALCFDPPVTGLFASSLDLSRDDREVEAFVGYTSGSVEAFVIRTNDHQLYNNNGHFGRLPGGGDYSHYDRQAFSERSGFLYR